MAGYSGKSVVQKLGIKPGFCIFVDGAPSDYGNLVGPLPADVKLVDRSGSGAGFRGRDRNKTAHPSQAN